MIWPCLKFPSVLQLRPDQIPPEGDWNTFLALAGRGWGKTKSAAEWVRNKVKQGHKRIAYVCAVNGDIEKVFVKWVNLASLMLVGIKTEITMGILLVNLSGPHQAAINLV